MQQEEISILPERVAYATFGQRFAAILLDILVLFTPWSIILSLCGNRSAAIEIFTGKVTAHGLMTDTLNMLMILLYFSLMESGKHQASVGKMVLKIKVTNLEGKRISFFRAFIRTINAILSKMIFYLGYFMVLWDSRHQALHDKIAGTLVVRRSKTA